MWTFIGNGRLLSCGVHGTDVDLSCQCFWRLKVVLTFIVSWAGCIPPPSVHPPHHSFISAASSLRTSPTGRSYVRRRLPCISPVNNWRHVYRQRERTGEKGAEKSLTVRQSGNKNESRGRGERKKNMTRGWGFVTWFTVSGLENERETPQAIKDPVRDDPASCAGTTSGCRPEISVIGYMCPCFCSFTWGRQHVSSSAASFVNGLKRL